MKPIRSFSIILISIILLLSFDAKAKAVYLNFNEQAPFAGLLLDDYSARQATLESKELVEYKKLDILNKEVIRTLNEQKENNQFVNALWFIGGVVAGLAACKIANGK